MLKRLGLSGFFAVVLSLGLIIFLQNITNEERVLAAHEAIEGGTYGVIQTQTFDQRTLRDTRYYEVEDSQPVGVFVAELQPPTMIAICHFPWYRAAIEEETRKILKRKGFCTAAECTEFTELRYPPLDLDVCISIVDGKVTKCLSEMPRRPLGITSL